MEKSDAKMELVIISSELMPAGKPNFLDIIKYPKITDLITIHNHKIIFKVIFLLVKDFCNSVNVVRNMNEDQMIEAASMLIEECDNFRLEDYVMMFTMAKRGVLVKIYDRLDIQVITAIIDEYWLRRKRAADLIQDAEMNFLDAMGSPKKEKDFMHSQDAKILEAVNGLAVAFESVRQSLIDDNYKPLSELSDKEDKK